MNDRSGSEAVPPVIEEVLPTNTAEVVESLLKRPLQIIRLAQSTEPRRLLRLATALIVGAGGYGVVVGTFSGGAQFWEAPIKLMIGIVSSALFCLPGLYMAACLSGRDVKVREVAGYLLAAVTLSTLLLLGAAPAAWLFSVSTNSLPCMGAVHLIIWAVATIAGLRFLSLVFGGLRGQLALWCLMFVLVCLQMTTTLRPLLGTSDRLLTQEKKFFVEHWWDCIR